MLFYVATRIAPAFCKHVPNVIGMSAKKEMGRIDARRVVTLVAYFHAVRNWAISQFPRDSMRQRAFVPDRGCSISVVGFTTLPFPAGIWACLKDALPEGLLSWLRDVVLGIKTARLPLIDSLPGDTRRGNAGFTSATALALAVGMLQAVFSHPRRIFVSPGQIGLTLKMAFDISDWLAFDIPLSVIGLLGKGCLLAATTFAEFNGRVGRGMMGLHKNLQFLCQAQDVSRVAGQLLLVRTPVSIAQVSA